MKESKVEIAIFGREEAYEEYDMFVGKLIEYLIDIDVAIEDEIYEDAAESQRHLENNTQIYALRISNLIPHTYEEVLEMMKTIITVVRNNLNDDK
tara:strand:- start:811 stop:1095 length:285 start_codon:yes stop_codon:yes gene_type:complete